MRRVVLVGAVSRGERNQDPESQLLPLRAVAARKPEWVVTTELKIWSSRWDDTAAAEVRRLAMAPIAEGRADVLAFWAWDRASRRGPEEAFSFLRELEEHYGAAFYSHQERFLCTEAPKETRELLLPLIAWIAKWDSQRRSDRLVAKGKNKRESSAKLGQRAVWGAGALASPDQVARVRELRATLNPKTGKRWSLRDLAREVGVSKSQADRILRGEVKSI